MIDRPARNRTLSHRRPFVILVLLLVALTVSAQYGPMGFVNCDGGITGGGTGQVVRVNNREDLARYAQSATPYIIMVEGRLEGNGLNRQRDVIDVHSDKTIVGTKGAELAGIGLNINGQQNIIIRNLVIHHADPDGIAARNSHHIWVDHCEIYSQDEAEREDWDGLIDLTAGSSYLTVSYCYIHDHHKACLLNSGTMHFEDNDRNRATYHHNAFVRTDQRNPRIGYGLGHVFCNYYQDIGSYAIGMHTQAQVLSEHNYFGPRVKHPFAQMYASSLDDAACAYFDDRGSHFAQPLPSQFKYQPTGTSFVPAQWYDYTFALDDTTAVASLHPAQTGPQEGLEHEPILWPGNGATGLPLTTRPQFSSIENMTQAEVFWGTAPDRLQPLAGIASVRLQPSTAYYWKVEARNDKGTHASPVYHFTTAGRQPSKPYPADGERNAQLRAATAANAMTAPMSLSWQPAADAQIYKVYLSTAANDLDSHLVASTAATTCNPGTLLYGQTYYWRVDAVTSDGETIRGDIWTFSAPACNIQTGRTELEHLARSAYAYLERQDGSWFKASNDTVTVGEAGPGAMTGVWTGEDGRYRVSIDFYDEKSGQAWMALSVNDVLVDSWQGNKQNGMTTHQVSESLLLHKGDQLRIDFYTQGKMRCRMDCIDIEPVNS
ncbi:MAG: polysaccharide lyase family 1 protein [Prevotella sp.]|nr:polysaccharide lyase family 1 protein [Prevotella sp.]